MKDGLIPIGEAAKLLHRGVPCLRMWDRRGYAAKGLNFRAERRDAATGTRYYRLSRILEIRAELIVEPESAKIAV